MSGKFIVIEGLEGAGKSSAVNIVEHCLKEANKGFIKVREPGGTPLAEALRELIKQPWQERVCAESEVLVMYAARMQLVRNVIEPALGKGEWVVGDRHDLSSQAYQGGGRELSHEMMQQLRDMTLGTFKPDLTLYLDIDPLLGLERAKGRGTLDRIEQENIEFFQRTRSRYLALAKADEDIETIDAAQSIEQVQADIRQRVQRFLKRHT